MAGTNPDFDAQGFRDAITAVQQMAMSPVDAEQPSFFMPSTLVYTGTPATASDGAPFDPAKTVQRVPPPPIRVPCSVTYYDRMGEITNIGLVTPTRISIDFLDEHYVKVKGCEFVVIDGDKYVYRRTEPPSGLFDVGIYTMHFDAEDES